MSSAEALIVEHLDLWSSTVKKKNTTGRGSSKKTELYGIKKLRELILELAVRGLLVPQDANDEPASVLLEKITAAKERLVKGEGAVKKKKAPLEVKEPFELPVSWFWKRLPEIAFFQEGPGIMKKDFRESGVPLIRISGMHEKKVSLDGCNFLDREMVDSKWGHFKLDLDDIVISSSASLGKVSKVGSETVGSIAYTGLIRFKPEEFIFDDYLIRFMSSSEFSRQIDECKTGAAIQHFGPSHLRQMVVPVPPLAEQNRIVTKVNELMTLCDQLEQQQESSITAHETLVETLLGALTNAPDNNTFQQAWQRIAENFDLLFTTEHSIEQLKQTILQLAVMGKLVPQDPNDEPASVLLKKIAEEKARLVKEKKIKKQKPLPPIEENEKPFELPVGWEWCRILSISNVGTGATPSRTNLSYFDPPEVNWVTSGETSEEFVGETKEKVSWSAVEETNVSVYPAGTLILAMYGQGKTRGQITELLQPAGTNQACAAIQLIAPGVHHRKYIKLFFVKAYDDIRKLSSGGAQPNLNVGKVTLTVIPVPPENEQHRIVTKVNELMTLCDNMLEHIKAAQTTQFNLTDAITEKALEEKL